jgi:arginyl-tRNA---protein transferase
MQPTKPTPTSNTTPPSFGTYHQKYYLNNTLVAVSVLDILPSCVSAVYFMYDPTSPVVRSLSLGVYSGLREISLVLGLADLYPGLKYYYMGELKHSIKRV